MADNLWDRIRNAGRSLARMLRSNARRQRHEAQKAERKKRVVERAQQRALDRKRRLGHFKDVSPALDITRRKPLRQPKPQEQNAKILLPDPPVQDRKIEEERRQQTKEAHREEVDSSQERDEIEAAAPPPLPQLSPQENVERRAWERDKERRQRLGRPPRPPPPLHPRQFEFEGETTTIGAQSDTFDVRQPEGRGKKDESGEKLLTIIRQALSEQTRELVEQITEVIKQNSGYGP